MKTYKKAEGFKILNYTIWRFLILSLIFLSISIFVTSHLRNKMDITEIRSSIMARRIFYSTNGISQKSEFNDRISAGIIDSKKFETKYLDGVFEVNEDVFSVSIFISSDSTNKEIFLNQKWYERYYPLAKFNQYSSNLKWKYTLFRENSTKSALLLIKTVEKNE